jgi:hypothetical protein
MRWLICIEIKKILQPVLERAERYPRGFVVPGAKTDTTSVTNANDARPPTSTSSTRKLGAPTTSSANLSASVPLTYSVQTRVASTIPFLSSKKEVSHEPIYVADCWLLKEKNYYFEFTLEAGHEYVGGGCCFCRFICFLRSFLLLFNSLDLLLASSLMISNVYLNLIRTIWHAVNSIVCFDFSDSN